MGLSIFRLIGRLIKIPAKPEKKHWRDFEYFDPAWKERIRLMAGYIPEKSKSVIDIGCGKMWLKEWLPANCNYFGIDYISRGEGSHVYDLNNYEFPASCFDAAFISGCLEYISDYDWLIREVASKSESCIVSYCNFDNFSNLEERRSLGWVNHLKEADLVALFSRYHMHLKQKDITSTANSIYVFCK